ncbi:MAG: LPXTG cell wall anchor domain-containing protein [Clostridia bacterium]|nr:LPXTG cell wall anchor domain-containing protein [Clostridia bacterium]
MKKLRTLAILLMIVMLTVCSAACAEETYTVKVDATKYLDDKDPGREKFAFKVWELTERQWNELFNIDILLSVLPENERPVRPVIPDDGVIEFIPSNPSTGIPNTGEKIESLRNPGIISPEPAPLPDDFISDDPLSVLTEDQLTKIADHLRKKLDKLPYTIVYNNGKTVPFIDETYAEEEFEKKYFAITEVHDPSKPFCYDHSVYGYSVDIVKFGIIVSPVLPPVMNDEVVRPPVSGDHIESIMVSNTMFCVSPEHGMHVGPVSEGIDEPADHFIFNNRTCKDVPQTGDNTNFAFLAALAVIGMIGMTVIIRKKNEA